MNSSNWWKWLIGVVVVGVVSFGAWMLKGTRSPQDPAKATPTKTAGEADKALSDWAEALAKADGQGGKAFHLQRLPFRATLPAEYMGKNAKEIEDAMDQLLVDNDESKKVEKLLYVVILIEKKKSDEYEKFQRCIFKLKQLAPKKDAKGNVIQKNGKDEIEEISIEEPFEQPFLDRVGPDDVYDAATKQAENLKLLFSAPPGKLPAPPGKLKMGVGSGVGQTELPSLGTTAGFPSLQKQPPAKKK